MNDRLFKLTLELLLAEAEAKRDEAVPGSLERDMWSAAAGNLDNARKRMRR